MTDRARRGPAPRRRLRQLMQVLALVGAVSLLSACGSDDDKSSSTSSSSGTSSQAANAPTGTPIVAYTFADVNTQGPQYKNIEETARIYGEWVNAHGGIKGHPLKVKFCDAKGTPTDATACARKAVADKAVAVVGSFTFTGDAIVPTLSKGKVAYWGMCCAISASELTNPDSFPMGNQPLYSVGLIKRAKEDGCQKTNGVIIQGAEAFKPIMQNAAKSYGLTIGKYITLPATARDYSPQVAEATGGGADCLVMIVSETPYIAWMPAFAQSGSKARMYGPQGNLNEKVAKGFEEVTNGDVVAGMYPDISLSQWKDYRAALDQYKADKGQDYNSLGGLGTWAAYQGFKQVIESMDGPITNASFLTAARTAKIDLPGMLPKEDFAKTWDKDGGPKGFDRLVDRCVVFSKLDNGKLKPLTTTFEDVSEAAGGKNPQDCSS
jgi:ABC-type branched-subunit amino acid transport system substrate-binding protein